MGKFIVRKVPDGGWEIRFGDIWETASPKYYATSFEAVLRLFSVPFVQDRFRLYREHEQKLREGRLWF